MAEPPEITPELEQKLSELEILRQALEETKNQSAQYFDQLLRLKAEFDNYRRRADREKTDARAWGKQEVLVQLISLVDVFEQALNQAHKAQDLKQVVRGVDMLYKSFSQFLKAESLEPIETEGLPFNPDEMEAIEQVEVENKRQVGYVVEELQKGYRFQGRILRPSRVRVGVAKKTAEEKEETPG
jgi:molecular chaperone GrpE